MAAKWMQNLHLKHGALHRELHVPMGQKIPESRLESAETSGNPTERRRATLAETFRKARRHVYGG